MEKDPPQARGRALTLAASLLAGCGILPVPAEAQRRRPDYYFLRYDVYAAPAPRGKMEAVSAPPAELLQPGRTLFVQASREAVVCWKEVRVRLRPIVGAKGETALESGEGKVATPPAGGGVLVGLGGASAFVRVEPLE